MVNYCEDMVTPPPHIVNAPTCVSIQPQLVHLFVHDSGVANEYIKLHSHLRDDNVRKARMIQVIKHSFPLRSYKQ